MDWSPFFPHFLQPENGGTGDDAQISSSSTAESAGNLRRQVEVLDIGCGFGGLLVALAPVMPETLMLGKFVTALPLTRSEPNCLRTRDT
jgi:tRNA G46 methylase TrmB